MRARVAERCGGCGEPIAVGAPLRQLRLPQVAGRRGTKVRCAACAGEPVPGDVPTGEPPPPPLDFTKVGVLPLEFTRAREHFRDAVALAAGIPRAVLNPALDWKTRQAGDREPGSDDE